MANESEIFSDPDFQRLLAKRSRWRWSLSGALIGIYFTYCLAGIYFKDAFSQPAIGTSITWGIVLGYLVIALAIVLSMVYIRVIGRLYDVGLHGRESQQ
ncbi:MAG: DUF485 domain-containing protein [Woeseiaceae bacterium]|nr:DUF485 domain-containing protein [Woeseiaceae bacterium]